MRLGEKYHHLSREYHHWRTKEKFEGHWRNFRSEEIKDFVVKSEKAVTYLGDIATITFKEKDISSYARSFGKGWSCSM